MKSSQLSFHMKSTFFYVLIALYSLSLITCKPEEKKNIDREALITRNSPHITEMEELSSLSVGNGNFAFTVDATGLQTFPEFYAGGIPLGTQSQWGWHSFPNPKKFKPEETLKDYNFRGWEEPYSVQFNEPGRKQEAANWFRANPHRLHLGAIGFEMVKKDGSPASVNDIQAIDQSMNLWEGKIRSSFVFDSDSTTVWTACHPVRDEIGANIHSTLIAKGQLKINLRFAYPTGKHTDDACDRTVPEKHKTEIVRQTNNSVILKRTLDSTNYYINISWEGKAGLQKKEDHYFILNPQSEDFTFTCRFTPELSGTEANISADSLFTASSAYWQSFWQKGGIIDFSHCTDSRAAELERRVVLSQYLLAIQSAGMYPPQETGLTYNSWFGKFHLEMHWWHAAHWPLWQRPELLERSMNWYDSAAINAAAIAERQGFKGVRWMKMTDPSATEAPSKVGSFLIWQQPHYIYMAELLYRNNPTPENLHQYAALIDKTAQFMASFVTYDEMEGRYVLKGLIPAQETLRASETINPPFELSYWHYALSVAQLWRERQGLKRKLQWDEIIDKLSPLAYNDDKLYLAAEDATDTYKDIRYTSDHPAILGAAGVLPLNKLIRADYMKNTLEWIWENWNWGKTWGWDYPMTAMNAARMGEPEKAVDALLMDKRTNTYLINGHNYQDGRLRVYLPGNGGLLTAVAMMCAGWDGCEGKNPGFPKNGQWDVRWENLNPMP